MPWLDLDRSSRAEPQEMNGYSEGACALVDTPTWKPLVLLVPLRLGLSDINKAYIGTLKVRQVLRERQTDTNEER